MPDTTTRDRLDPSGIAVMMICCVLWGGNAVAVKFAVPDFPPLGCAAIRFALGLPVMALVCKLVGQPLWFRRDAWALWLLNSVFSVIQIGIYNWGTGHSEAGRSAVFINIHPLVVAPLAWLILGEKLGGRGVIGLLAATGGVILLLAEPLRRGGGFVGDVVVLLAGIVFGIQTIVQKKTFPRIPPATLLFSQTVAAAPIAALYSLAFEGFLSIHPRPEAIWGVLYQGLAVSGVCFGVWMVLLRRYPAGRLATVAFLTPLFGVALGHILRKEALTFSLVAGGCFVGIGIFLVSSDRTAHQTGPDLALPGEDAP
jgi:drug/metabolite transporter (DMT)-like permease